MCCHLLYHFRMRKNIHPSIHLLTAYLGVICVIRDTELLLFLALILLRVLYFLGVDDITTVTLTYSFVMRHITFYWGSGTASVVRFSAFCVIQRWLALLRSREVSHFLGNGARHPCGGDFVLERWQRRMQMETQDDTELNHLAVPWEPLWGLSGKWK